MISKMDIHLWFCRNMNWRLTLDQCYKYGLMWECDFYGEKIMMANARSMWFKDRYHYYCHELKPKTYDLEYKISKLGL